MPISPVSNVSFTAVDFARPGKYSQQDIPESVQAPAESKGKKAGKIILTTAAILAAVAAIVTGLTKGGVVSKLETLEGAKFLDKLKHYTAVAGDTIAKYTYEPIVALFKGKGTAEVADVAEEAAEAAAGVGTV